MGTSQLKQRPHTPQKKRKEEKRKTAAVIKELRWVFLGAVPFKEFFSVFYSIYIRPIVTPVRVTNLVVSIFLKCTFFFSAKNHF